MKRFMMLLVAFVFAFGVFASQVFSEEKKGKIDSFKEELNKPSDTHDETAGLAANEAAAEGVIQLLSNFFMMGLMTTGESSTEFYKSLKEEWSPALPTFRLEPDYQYVFDGVHGMTWKGELGYLFFGADGEYTRYFETGASDHLDVYDAHALLRTMFVNVFGINLALGFKSFGGERNNTGFDFGLPFYIYFGKHFILDCLPYITTLPGKDVYDISGGLSYKYKFFGARASYRAIFVGTQTLQGPAVGIFLQW